MERIVVGVDGSDGARVALEWAVAEAKLRKAKLVVVHAWSMPYIGGLPTTPPIDVELVQTQARALLDAAVASIADDGLREKPEPFLFFGSPAEGLLKAAQDAELLVVGTRGRGGFVGLLLGSVSHQVAQHAPCPVVVVPSRP